MDKLHDLLGELQKIREASDPETGRAELIQAVSHAFNILDSIEHDSFETDSEEVRYEAVMNDLAELKAHMEDPYELKGLKDPDDPSDRKVVTDPETGKPKWSDESIGEHDATDDKENQNLGRFVTQTLLKKDLLKTDKYPEDMIGKFIENVLRRYESKVTPEQDESVKMSHVGKDVDQTLSYDNWLKQKKGILRGARGITGPEHNKFAKEYKAYKKK